MLKLKIPLQISLALLLAACVSGTKLEDSWQSENLDKKKLDNVLVVALTSNISTRILYEEEFAKIFTNRGVTAIASYDEIGDDTPKREDVVAYVKDHNIDYVLVTRMGGLDISKDYVPPRSVTYYSGPFYPTMGDYWVEPVATFNQAEHNITHVNVVLTTSIYDAASEELVWVGRSKTFNVESVSIVAKDLAKEIDQTIHR